MKIESFEVPKLPTVTLADMPEGVPCVCHYNDGLMADLLVRERLGDDAYGCCNTGRGSHHSGANRYAVISRVDGQPLPQKEWSFDDLLIGEHFKVKRLPNAIFLKHSDDWAHGREAKDYTKGFFEGETIHRLGFRDVPE